MGLRFTKYYEDLPGKQHMCYFCLLGMSNTSITIQAVFMSSDGREARMPWLTSVLKI